MRGAQHRQPQPRRPCSPTNRQSTRQPLPGGCDLAPSAVSATLELPHRGDVAHQGRRNKSLSDVWSERKMVAEDMPAESPKSVPDNVAAVLREGASWEPSRNQGV